MSTCLRSSRRQNCTRDAWYDGHTGTRNFKPPFIVRRHAVLPRSDHVAWLAVSWRRAHGRNGETGTLATGVASAARPANGDVRCWAAIRSGSRRFRLGRLIFTRLARGFCALCLCLVACRAAAGLKRLAYCIMPHAGTRRDGGPCVLWRGLIMPQYYNAAGYVPRA